MSNLVATAGGVAIYGEFKVISGDSDDGLVVFIGAVLQKDGLDLNKSHVNSDNDEAYFMSLDDGSLYCNCKNGSDKQGYGCVKAGDRIGVLVKAGPEGFVRFYKNSKAFGGTFSGPIESPVAIAVQIGPFSEGVSLELLSGAIEPDIAD